ncbi:hypothetical protein KIPB_002142 [Kipferlia bialata]|uniref:Uncharacterized protein n=1 Tax=Kipferlia bialata TaxID=797122 RepID=A0A9K3CRU5_9EUKA|nr:hypothetical protein KIPB_002142 [Kipferlia bialata]|eukprot:g2142.t1
MWTRYVDFSNQTLLFGLGFMLPCSLVAVLFTAEVTSRLGEQRINMAIAGSVLFVGTVATVFKRIYL